ncbi:MAG: lasso peptide biosynthesis B2 protein [Actinomycetota bacterium]|nr:lasso peptide biosynthesis B2 protein [Actinomycetota bacterium]
MAVKLATGGEWTTTQLRHNLNESFTTAARQRGVTWMPLLRCLPRAPCEVAGGEEGGRALNVGDGTRHSFRTPAAWKVRLAIATWYSLVVVVIGLRLLPLPELVKRLGRKGPRMRPIQEPAWLGHVVWRVLHVGRWRPRCLLTALVFLRLLRLQGRQAEIVIGLPYAPTNRDAHAWIEMGGVDVGPPPGRAGHVELVRYG